MSLAIGFTSITFFAFTVNMALPMVMVDALTLPYGAILIVQVAIALVTLNLSRKDIEIARDTNSPEVPTNEHNELPAH